MVSYHDSILIVRITSMLHLCHTFISHRSLYGNVVGGRLLSSISGGYVMMISCSPWRKFPYRLPIIFPILFFNFQFTCHIVEIDVAWAGKISPNIKSISDSFSLFIYKTYCVIFNGFPLTIVFTWGASAFVVIGVLDVLFATPEFLLKPRYTLHWIWAVILRENYNEMKIIWM